MVWAAFRLRHSEWQPNLYWEDTYQTPKNEPHSTNVHVHIYTYTYTQPPTSNQTTKEHEIFDTGAHILTENRGSLTHSHTVTHKHTHGDDYSV